MSVNATEEDIDFDRVERELIPPALERLGILGRTTLDILRMGNIRTDMFQALLVADVVVAGLSIHNANVFYELGLRSSWPVPICRRGRTASTRTTKRTASWPSSRNAARS